MYILASIFTLFAVQRSTTYVSTRVHFKCYNLKNNSNIPLGFFVVNCKTSNYIFFKFTKKFFDFLKVSRCTAPYKITNRVPTLVSLSMIFILNSLIVYWATLPHRKCYCKKFLRNIIRISYFCYRRMCVRRHTDRCFEYDSIRLALMSNKFACAFFFSPQEQ